MRDLSLLTWKPGAQVHWNEPGVSEHEILDLPQLSNKLISKHSSMLTQADASVSFLYPAAQMQEYPP